MKYRIFVDRCRLPVLDIFERFLQVHTSLCFRVKVDCVHVESQICVTKEVNTCFCRGHFCGIALVPLGRGITLRLITVIIEPEQH